MTDWVGMVLAAGEGSRMNSRIPKVLHKVCGKSMISHVVGSLKRAGIERVLVVVSPGNIDAVRKTLGNEVWYVLQREPLGTGHAVLQCAAVLGES